MANNYWYIELLGNIEVGYTTEIKYFNQPYHEAKGFSEKGALGDGTSITKYDGHLTSIEEAKAITKIPRTGEIGILSLGRSVSLTRLNSQKWGNLLDTAPSE